MSQTQTPTAASRDRETALMKGAKAAIDERKYQQAAEILSEVIALNPKNLTAFLTLIDLLLVAWFPGDTDLAMARKLADLGSKLFPGSPQIADRSNWIERKRAQKAAWAASQPRLAAMRGIHRGERCVIIGNGPSLNKMDLSFLRDEYSFGLNRIYLGFERFGFTPTYLVSVNRLVIEQSAAELAAVPCTKFISFEGVPLVQPADDLVIINPREWRDYFSTDPLQGLCIGSTVTYVAMQLAFWMGFDDVVLIGVDHRFETKGEPHKVVESRGDDPNHFDPGYFGKGFNWQLPDLKESEQMFRIADAYFRAFRNKVVDATVDGACPVFEKADYVELFYSGEKKEQLQAARPNHPLEQFRNRYEGERLFVIGNGPSLEKTPLDLLEGEYTFAMNRIALLYENTSWRPDFFLCTTTNVARPDWNADIRKSVELGVPCFVWDRLEDALPSTENVHYIECTGGPEVTPHAPDEWWSDDITRGVTKFGTSLLPVLQIAAYMGFKEIYLLGCDLGFRQETGTGADPNHFHPGYGTPGFSADILNVNMKAAHELAARAAERLGIRIYNATLGGELEVYPRVDLFEVLGKKSADGPQAGEANRVRLVVEEPCQAAVAPERSPFREGSVLELLDPAKIDSYAYDQGVLEKIRAHSLLPGHRIGWNYCLDYSWLAMQWDRHFRPGMRVLDIGCGPGAIHGYLERTYGVEILGIDTRRWAPDYVDVVGDFTDPQVRAAHDLGPRSLDVIISTSAFEHNPPDAHRRLVEVCLESLKPGGCLMTTFSAGKVLGEEASAHQWNLPREQLESIYGIAFESFDYDAVRERWRNHREIPTAYRKRYGKWDESDPDFLAAGAVLLLPTP